MVPVRMSVGPTFAGAWGKQVPLSNGSSVVFDDNYFRESMLAPNAKIRLGYPAAQPSFEGKLTEKEIEGLTVYVKSLGSIAPAVAKVDCTLPGKLDTGGKQAAEYKCSKIDFKTKACQCSGGAFAMRTADNVALCHVVPAECPAPTSEPVATSRPARPPTPAVRPIEKPSEKPPEKKPPEKKPDELWMQMTHDKDKAKK